VPLLDPLLLLDGCTVEGADEWKSGFWELDIAVRQWLYAFLQDRKSWNSKPSSPYQEVMVAEAVAYTNDTITGDRYRTGLFYAFVHLMPRLVNAACRAKGTSGERKQKVTAVRDGRCIATSCVSKAE
jgi:hypothetical protein